MTCSATSLAGGVTPIIPMILAAITNPSTCGRPSLPVGKTRVQANVRSARTAKIPSSSRLILCSCYVLTTSPRRGAFMSTGVYVFFAGQLPTKAELQQALQELEFPFSIKTARGSLERQSGYMPMRLDRQDTGVEFDLEGGRTTIEELLPDGVDPAFD